MFITNSLYTSFKRATRRKERDPEQVQADGETFSLDLPGDAPLLWLLGEHAEPEEVRGNNEVVMIAG